MVAYLVDPQGHKEELKASPNNDKLKTYSVTYYPTQPGVYEVNLLRNLKETVVDVCFHVLLLKRASIKLDYNLS